MQEVSVKDLRANPGERQKPSTFFARKGRMVEVKALSEIKKGKPFVLINEGEEMKLAKGTLLEVVREDDEVVSFYATSKGVMTGPAIVRATSCEPSAVPSMCTVLGNLIKRYQVFGWLMIPLLMLAVLGQNAEHPSVLGLLWAASMVLVLVTVASTVIALVCVGVDMRFSTSWEVSPKGWPPVVRTSVFPDATSEGTSEVVNAAPDAQA